MSKVDKINMDEAFGKAKVDIKTMDSKFQTLVSDNISLIGSALDEYIASYRTEIANLKSDEHMVMRISLETHGYFVKAVTSNSHVNDSKSIDFESKVSRFGFEYTFKNLYYYEVDKNLINMDILIPSELSQLKANCEKYLANSINIDKIEINHETNEIKVFVDLRDYITKAANDFSRFVVAYLAKQGIKSRARQTDNEVEVVIERDTDTGGFEEI